MRGGNWPSGTQPCWQQNTPGLLPLSPQLRAWSRSQPHRILLIVPDVCGPGHAGHPSSQPCTSCPIFPCPIWGTLPDLLASGKPSGKPKNHSLFPSGVSLSNCRGKITGQRVCATSGVQPRVAQPQRHLPTSLCPESCLLQILEGGRVVLWQWSGQGSQLSVAKWPWDSLFFL